MKNGMSIKEDTLKDHLERINRVHTYIQEHLDEPLRLDKLAGVACFSPFHFHRLFAAFTGETLKSHIRRLRVEMAAHRLSHTQLPVTEIALSAGYETPSAFTKAFQQQFQKSQSEFRKEKSYSFSVKPLKLQSITQERTMQPEIRTRPEMKVIFVRRTGNYSKAAAEAWPAICRFAFSHRLVGRDAEFIGISHDDPDITAEDKLRYDASITVAREVKPEGEIGVKTLAGGTYAVFLHQGPYENLHKTYREIYGGWLPSSGKQLRDVPCFEIYLNDPQRTKPENLKTEICVPIQ